MNQEKQPPKSENPSVDSDLQAETQASPESAWFFAWFKSAMLYLATVTAYLVAVTALVAAWKKFIASPDEKADLTIYILAGILALPLLFAFLFNLLPAIRRRRERHLRPTGRGAEDYFDTAPREHDPYGFFGTGYDAFVDWAREPRAPLLHLTGLSGSGKSSLLSACLSPRLAPATRLLIVRSYHDPLAALKVELLVLWKEKPKGYDALSPLDALRRAARQLGEEERLLVAFDQFEEFFLLRAIAPEKTADSPAGTTAAPTVSEADLTPLRDFLQGFSEDPPERAALLLSYREDHRRLLAPLKLAGREERRNWMTVDPLDFAAAAGFLRSCPGLAIPEERMQRVLREAARQEGGRVVMRPIVANLLGLILRQMSAHPTLWRRTGDLLRGYVRDCLGTELQEERARLLRALLTDFHTARPRPAAEIAREARLDPAALESHLEHLGRAGLLRCVNRDEPSSAHRIWQVAHDFLATLIERTLDGLHRTVWRALRPWLAPAAIALVLVLGVFWPWVEEHRAISLLANAGFTWNKEKAEIVAATIDARKIQRLDQLAGALRRLQPRSIDLNYCEALQNVDGLKGLTALQNLNLNNCDALHDVDGLEGLTALQNLDLSDCEALQNVDGLEGLTDLQNLDLSDCDALHDVDGLEGLTALHSLDLSDCDALQNVDGLEGLTALQNLDLSDCDALHDVDGLKGLTALHSLDLRNCNVLHRVDGLKGLTALNSLDLSYCNILQRIDGLKGLTALRSLDLSGCDALQNVDGLGDLTGLQNLNLSFCDALQNVDAIKGLTALHSLDLSFCRALQNVDAIKGLTALLSLDLSGCRALQNVDVLKGLTALQSVDLSACDALQNVDGLKGITGLKNLNLSFCNALQNVDGLKGLTALHSLDLSDCDALQNVDGLKGITALQGLDLSDCDALQNVDGLKDLTALHSLDLSDCDALQNVDGLKGLTALQSLDLSFCRFLQDVDALEGLTALRSLDLRNCKAIPKESGEALKVALSSTRIIFPDGSTTEPPNSTRAPDL